MKNYYIMFNIGKAKYVVNHHDGVDTHKDGSPFYNVTIFKNKKKMKSYITDLCKKGYVERGYQA